MPKIIENVREQLLKEAKRQIEMGGYAGMTIRSVAGACGLGVGTVYNYFSSKDMLIASFMLEEWQSALERMMAAKSKEPYELLHTVYDSIEDFIRSNKALFSDAEAVKSFNTSHSNYHAVLRAQIAKIVAPVVNNMAENADFAAEFIAESLLTWTVAGKSFETIYSVLKSIINNI